MGVYMFGCSKYNRESIYDASCGGHLCSETSGQDH